MGDCRASELMTGSPWKVTWWATIAEEVFVWLWGWTGSGVYCGGHVIIFSLDETVIACMR